MSGTCPRSWAVGNPKEIDDPDVALLRVWDALESPDWDEVELVVNPLLDALQEEHYVDQWGRSDTGCLRAITEQGHRRLRALGRDA